MPCALLCSQTTDATPLLCEREPQCSNGGDAAVDIAAAVGERAALLRRRSESGAQLHAYYSVLEREQLAFEWPPVQSVQRRFWHCA